MTGANILRLAFQSVGNFVLSTLPQFIQLYEGLLHYKSQWRYAMNRFDAVIILWLRIQVAVRMNRAVMVLSVERFNRLDTDYVGVCGFYIFSQV